MLDTWPRGHPARMGLRADGSTATAALRAALRGRHARLHDALARLRVAQEAEVDVRAAVGGPLAGLGG